MEKLKDIKDIVEVSDYSLYILISIILASILIIFIIIYFFKNQKKSKKLTPKEIALNELQNINFSDTKRASYSFSENGYLFVNEANREAFEEIEEELLKHKYKKEVLEIDEELKIKMQEFIKEIS